MLTLNLDNPDLFGETLRNWVFQPDGFGTFGCYSTFKTRPEFQPVDPETPLGIALLDALGYVDGDTEYWYQGVEGVTLLSDGEIHVAWYWDGDGILAFMAQGKTARNDDCKKTYGWEWVE